MPKFTVQLRKHELYVENICENKKLLTKNVLASYDVGVKGELIMKQKLLTLIVALVIVTNTGCSVLRDMPAVSETAVTDTTVVTTKPAVTTTAKKTTKPTTKPATTKPATTTKPSDNDTVIIPVRDDISSRAMIEYKYGKQVSGKKSYLYNFSNSMSSGFGRDGSFAFTRMYYGVTVSVDNDSHTLYITPYNDYPEVFDVTVKSACIESDHKTANLTNNFETKSIDLSKLENGRYIIRITFSNDKTASAYFYVNGKKTYTCVSMSMSNNKYNEIKARRDRIDKLIEVYEVTPENQTDTSELVYPVDDNPDVEYWKKLSHKLADKYESDDAKVFAFHEWMSENLSYDYYCLYTLKTTRQNYYRDYTGKYHISNTKTGKCADFANVMLIMCRENNIPCTTIETPTHTWNLVYLNGQWMEIDMTTDIEAALYSEDVTQVTEPKSRYCYDSINPLKTPWTNTEDLYWINVSICDKAIFEGTRSYHDASKLDPSVTA